MFTFILFGLCFWILYLVFQIFATLVRLFFSIIGCILAPLFDFDDAE